MIRELARRGLRHTIPLFLLLASEADGRACRLNQGTLALKLATTERTVRRHEAELAEAGYLQVVRGGPHNRRMLVLLGLVPRDAATADGPIPRVQVLHTIPQPAVETGHPCPVSRERETGHAAPVHNKDRADAGARAETLLSVSSARPGPWRTWTRRAAAFVAALGSGKADQLPDGPSPSRAVDDALQDLHDTLGMWPNTLREAGAHARAICRSEGEEDAVTYLENLERWCKRFPAARQGKLALGALRKRAARGGPGARQATMDALFQEAGYSERAGAVTPRA